MLLEELQPGVRVSGILIGRTVQILAATPMGADAVRVVFETTDGVVDQQILMRANEPQLGLVLERPTLFNAKPDEFKLAAEALRILRATGMAVVEPERSFQALPHQLEAVYEHLLEYIPLRFLLADDPGAGKTIMAGLFIRELDLRGALERCLIVAPGGLVEQWQQELRDKFGLEFDVLSTDDIRHIVAGGALFDRRTRVIARMDQVARSKDVVDAFRGASWDVVIVDEAHRMSAHYGAGREIKPTLRYKLGLVLRDATRHLLLMTATPHAGKQEDFQLFMCLVDPDRFEGRFRPGLHATGAEGLMIRRTKEDMLTLEGKPLFPPRAAYTVPYELSREETALYAKVTAYVSREFDRADDLDKGRGTTVGFALTVLQRRLASSPEAILKSLERRHERLTQALATFKESSKATTRRDVELAALTEEYPAGEREDFEDEVVVAATAARTPDELKREIEALTSLVAAARKVRDAGTDRKWSELRGLLETSPTIVGPDSNIRKIIIFTEHKDTLHYLVERTRGVLGQRGSVVSIHGAMGRDQRLAVQRRFTTDPACRVLIATDAAGEGLNLQAAHLMINYDLPWNPNRIEQRFGRIHRIGQQEMCHLWNLVAGKTREGAVYLKLLDKLNEMRNALSGKAFDVLGQVFEGHPLHRLLIEAIRHGDDPKVKAHLETIIDERVGDLARKLAEERALSPEVYRVGAPDVYRRRIQDAKAARLQPYYAEGFFKVAFEDAGGRITRREPGRWEIPYVPTVVREFDRSVSLPVRFPLVCFDPDVREVEGQPNAELLGPGRPLFDLVVRYTLERHGHALESGAVLIDRLDPGDRPRLLAAIDSEIVDGANNLVDRRFGFVEIHEDHSRLHNTARFLDYDTVSPDELELTKDLIEQPWMAHAAHTAETWATSADLPHWYDQVNTRRRQQVARMRDLVTDRLKQEIGHWEAVAARAESSEADARSPSSAAAWREVHSLRARLDRRLAELDAQETTRVSPPRALAVALVVPQGLLDKRRGHPSSDTIATELRALHAVWAAEQRLGRTPEMMPHNHPGFDVTSADPTGELVYIEVKGRLAGADNFYVTYNEIKHGQNAELQYRLALVEVSPLGPAHDTVRYVERPFAGVTVTALVKGMQFSWNKTWASGRDPW